MMKTRIMRGPLGHCFTALWLNALLTVSCPAAQLKLLSVPDTNQTLPAGGNGSSVAPVLSSDGRYVLFASTAKDLVLKSNGVALSGNFPARFNVFRRDRSDNTTILVSVNIAGDGGNGDSMPAGISDDGRFALFESRASDLVNGDTNQAADIFVRDLSSNQTILVSSSTNAGFANGDSRSSVITPDGRFVAFVSAANNLVTGDTNHIVDVFVRDLQSNTTEIVSVGALVPFGSTAVSESPLITSDGRYVAFYSSASNLVAGVKRLPNIYVRDLASETTIWASSGASNWLFLTLFGLNGVCCNHSISADGQFVCYEVFSTPPSTKNQGIILRYNLQSGVTELVHTNAATVPAPFEDGRTVSMTPDGRFIAFVAKTNFFNSPTNFYILLWDGFSGRKTIVAGGLQARQSQTRCSTGQ
jgi:Tol biopolymer transport system component